MNGELAVVFVNFHSEHLIGPRASMLADEGFAVVVVDNSGTFPEGGVRRVEMDGNQGFGAACNRGVAALPAQVDTVCFHNPDVDARPQVLRSLHLLLREQRAPGAVAPAERVGRMVLERGYHYPGFARELALAARSAGRWRYRGARLPLTAPAQPASGPVRPRGGRGRRFAGGGLLVVDRRAHEAIGGFDEEYFLYVEDLDYWHRLGRAGYQTEFAPHLRIDHTAGTGSPLDGFQREVLRWVGVELFAEKRAAAWLPYRHLHRWLLSSAPIPPSPLMREVRARWDEGATPSATSEAVRALARQNLGHASP